MGFLELLIVKQHEYISKIKLKLKVTRKSIDANLGQIHDMTCT